MTPPRPGGESNREAMPTVAAQGALVTAMPTQRNARGELIVKGPFQYIAIYVGVPGHEVKGEPRRPQRRMALVDREAEREYEQYWWNDDSKDEAA